MSTGKQRGLKYYTYIRMNMSHNSHSQLIDYMQQRIKKTIHNQHLLVLRNRKFVQINVEEMVYYNKK